MASRASHKPSPRLTLSSTTLPPQPRRRAAQGLPSDPIIVPIDSLRPTQVAVGMRAVAAKRKRLGARKRRKMGRYLERRPIPAVYGPGQELYIVDHHHLSLALLQSRVTNAFVQIIDDYSDLSPKQFWAAMETQGLVYPFDETGSRVALSRMPRAINSLKADVYRDLAWSVREAGGFKKTRAPYSEFRWAEFFRTTIPSHLVTDDYERAVILGRKLARSAAAAGLPGYVGH
ncbi:MAG: ParB-like protein [Hyphomicrobiaceae bacterium]|nr:ParB-like protein [Hyphomicrobiaceae bacterium]